jgi:UPF0176 protein
MGSVLNIAAYRFVPLDDLPALRERLLGLAGPLALKGTVLLAEEGLNLFLAGAPAQVDAFLAALCRDARFAGLSAKRSLSDAVPFQRLKVKIRREIIRMDCPTVRPATGRAPGVAPRTLQRWLAAGRDDAGREVVMLDTRNAFEVAQGRFEGAIDWQLSRFGEFPAAVRAHREALRSRTVVTYCTGGIRCEKANLLMRAEGFEQVYQLDGGILQYFEDTDGAPHWQGRCVVFDERGALDADLAPAAPPSSPAPPLPGGHKATQREDGRTDSLRAAPQTA